MQEDHGLPDSWLFRRRLFGYEMHSVGGTIWVSGCFDTGIYSILCAAVSRIIFGRIRITEIHVFSLMRLSIWVATPIKGFGLGLN